MEQVAEWVPPRIAGLHIVERGGRWLCMNPAVPGWLATTHAGSLLLKLVDGKRTVGEIGQLVNSAGLSIDQRFIDEFFGEGRNGKLFEPAPAPPDLESFWRDRKLTAMHLHLTDRCNLHCNYCLRGSSPDIVVRHGPDRFIAMLQFIREFASNDMEVTFTGGEPLMYPGFHEVAESSSQAGFTNVLFTNGILVTESTAAFIAKHFSRAQVSLDGVDRQSHAQTRGDNFRQVLKGINRLHDAGVTVAVQVTLSTFNIESATQIHDILPDDVSVKFTPAMAHGRGEDVSEIFISSGEFIDFSQSASDPSTVQYYPGVQTRRCSAGISNISISDAGDVFPCHLFHKDEFNFGNLFHDDFRDIFFGDRIRNYVDSMDVSNNNSVCAQCEVRYLCGGGCKANAMAATGDYHGVDMWCSYLKEMIYSSLLDVVPNHGGPSDIGESGNTQLSGAGPLLRRPLSISVASAGNRRKRTTMDTTT